MQLWPALLFVCVVAIFALLFVVLLQLRRRSGDAESDVLRCDIERFERLLTQELARQRAEQQGQARDARAELLHTHQNLTDSLLVRIKDIAALLKEQHDVLLTQQTGISSANEQRFEKLREVVDQRLRQLQEDNGLKLEQMRATVDEKLHATL